MTVTNIVILLNLVVICGGGLGAKLSGAAIWKGVIVHVAGLAGLAAVYAIYTDYTPNSGIGVIIDFLVFFVAAAATGGALGLAGRQIAYILFTPLIGIIVAGAVLGLFGLTLQ